MDRLTKCSVKKGTRMGITGSLGMSEYLRATGESQIKQRKAYVKVSSFQVLSAKEIEEFAPAEGECSVVESRDSRRQP